MKMPSHKPATKWMTTVIVLLSLGFYIYFTYCNIDKIPPLNWSLVTTSVLFLSIVLVVFNIFIGGIIWHLLLLDNGVPVSCSRTQMIYSIAQFGKYLPGNIGQHLGRVVLAREVGIPLPTILSTMFVEIFWGLGIGAGFALLSLFFFVDGQRLGLPINFGLMHLGLGFIVLLLMPWIGIGALKRFLPRQVKRFSGAESITIPKLRTALTVAALLILCFMIMGGILKIQAQYLFNVAESNPLELASLFALGWLAGYLTPGAPGGLGIREAMMVLLLSPIVGAGAAVGLGVSLRVTTTLGDGLAFLLGLLLKRFSTREKRDSV